MYIHTREFVEWYISLLYDVRKLGRPKKEILLIQDIVENDHYLGVCVCVGTCEQQ